MGISNPSECGGTVHLLSSFFSAHSKNFYKFIINLIRMIRVCRCFRRGLKGFQGYQLIEKDFRGEIEEDHFPFRAIQITRKPPAWRTDQEVRHLKNRLQLLESFRQYSPTLQTLLARVVRFEQYVKKKEWNNVFFLRRE
uniref:Uncharacterized protein n=1 Tax=Anolis carolinensis TaxID=28377 RepID=H9G9G5_ANOCA